MKTTLRLETVLLAGLHILLPATAGADIAEDFNGGWSDPSYAGLSTYNHAGVGIWESNDALVESANARSGEAVRFDDGATSPYLVYGGPDGNGLDGGIESVSFWYRHWNGDGQTVSFALEYSVDGGGWIEAGNATVTTATAYQLFSAPINSESDNIRIRIRGTATGERLLIDDFLITSPGDDNPAPPASGSLTIMAANTTSGNHQRYEGPGDRIFEALDPDIVGIQEFSVPDAGGLRAWVDRVFGPEFHFMVEVGDESIPCGVISRYPITASGEWQDPQVGDRDFAWATIDIPGALDLHVVSVHLHGSGGSSSRNIEAGVLVNEVTNTFPAGDYIVLCGDLNTTSRSEAAIQTLSSIFSDSHVPVDQAGNSQTNQGRNKPYDWVMPNAPLESIHGTVTVGGTDFPHGLVFDSRLWSPPPPPALATDSGVSSMQHMAVMKSFRLPLFTALGTSILWLEAHGISSDFDSAELLDQDGDGALTWQEYLSDTNPNDPDSVFAIETVEGVTSISVSCHTRPNRRYEIEFSDVWDADLHSFIWSKFASPANGQHHETNPAGTSHIFIDDHGPATTGGPPANDWRLYRIGVSVP